MVPATALIVAQQGSPFQPTEVQLNPLQSREVLVRLHATGICHTDLAVQHGKIHVPLPAVLGHEGEDLDHEILSLLFIYRQGQVLY